MSLIYISSFFVKKREVSDKTRKPSRKPWRRINRLIAGSSSMEQCVHTQKCDVFLRYFADWNRGIQSVSPSLHVVETRAPRCLRRWSRSGSVPLQIAGPRRRRHSPRGEPTPSQVSLPCSSLARASHFYELVSARCNLHRNSALVLAHYPDYRLVYHFAKDPRGKSTRVRMDLFVKVHTHSDTRCLPSPRSSARRMDESGDNLAPWCPCVPLDVIYYF